MSKIIFLGCGIMGSNLIRAFMEDGHDVTIVNRTKEKAESFIDRARPTMQSLPTPQSIQPRI